MPTVVRVGCSVSSRAGPLSFPNPGSKRRSRAVFHGIILGSGRSSSNTERTWKVLWTECGKCCDHSAKILKVTADADPSFDPQAYKNLREIDYFHSISEFLEFIDQDQFTTGFEINLAQNSDSSSTLITTPVSIPSPSEDASAVTSLMLLSSTSVDRSRPLLDMSIVNSEESIQNNTESPVRIRREVVPQVTPDIPPPPPADVTNFAATYDKEESEGNPDNETEENFDLNSIVMEILAHECDDKHTLARLNYLSEKLECMDKVVKVSGGRPTRVTTWTVVGDVLERDVPQTIERHEDIGIGDFDFNDKEVSSGKRGNYERINLLGC